MVFKIHFTLKDGSEDFITVSIDSYDEIPKIKPDLDKEIERRGGTNPWSERVD